MKKYLGLFIFLVLLGIIGFVDPYARRIRPFTSVPAACAENEIGYSMTLHGLYICTNGGYKSVDISGATTYVPLSSKDATGGYAGLTLFKIDFKNAANTFTSFFTNANTAARTYTFQDRDGTIADDTDLALKANLASPTFTGTVVMPLTTFSVGNTTSATTDLLINPTTKASGNFIDAQVNGTSKFKIDFAGVVSAGTSVHAGEPLLIRAAGAAAIDTLASRVLRLSTNSNQWTTIHFNDITTSDGYIGYLGSATATTRKFCISADGVAGLNFCVDGLGKTFIGSGASGISKHLSNTATLDFANLAAIGCEDLTITVTGAALGDTTSIGVPNGSVVANGTFTGWVSATNTVSVRFCTVVSGDPASGTFRADVWQH